MWSDCLVAEGDSGGCIKSMFVIYSFIINGQFDHEKSWKSHHFSSSVATLHGHRNYWKWLLFLLILLIYRYWSIFLNLLIIWFQAIVTFVIVAANDSTRKPENQTVLVTTFCVVGVVLYVSNASEYYIQKECRDYPYRYIYFKYSGAGTELF